MVIRPRSRQKRIYDTLLAVGVGIYLPFFGDVTRVSYPAATVESILIRGCGTGALLLLHVGDSRATIAGAVIRRDGRELIEVENLKSGERVAPPPRVELGRFTLMGEIVDSKCYFGVMNPAQGRVHRACAELGLRGGIPAVWVARDRSGAAIHDVLSGGEGSLNNEKLLPWVGEPVEVSGEVTRVGRWLTTKPEFDTLRFAKR